MLRHAVKYKNKIEMTTKNLLQLVIKNTKNYGKTKKKGK